jgi:hypothetical protein
LRLDRLPIQGLDAISPPVGVDGSIQVFDRDADVVQIEQFHDREAIDPDR